MKPEEQQIAIAKACGWYLKTVDHGDEKPYEGWFCDGVGHHIRIEYSDLLPKYHNDLNAMHEAEKTLNEDETLPNSKKNYSDELAKVVKNTVDENGCHGYWDNMATAAQRAEAFLKTLNLWEKKL